MNIKKIVIGLFSICFLWNPGNVHAGFFDKVKDVALGAVGNAAGGMVSSALGGGFLGGIAGGLTETLISGGSGSKFMGGTADAMKQNLEGRVTDFQNQIAGGGRGPDGKFEVASYAGEFNTIGQHTSLRQYILNVLNFFLSFLGLICVAATIYAGFLYISAQGDDGKMETAKKLIMYVVIGIIVVLMSFALVNTLIKNVGTGGDDRGGGDSAASSGGLGAGASGGTIGNTLNPSSGSATPYQQSLIDQLLQTSPIVIHGEEGVQIKDLGMGTWIAPEYALTGVQIGLSRAANALIYYGDGIQERINTVENAGATVTHIFVEEGKKTLRVIAEEASGPATYNADIYIGGIEAVIRAPIIVNAGDMSALDGSLSETLVGGIVSYQWSCPDGVEGCNSGANSFAIFTRTGTFPISLTITTNFGVSRTAIHNIQVVGEDVDIPADFTY